MADESPELIEREMETTRQSLADKVSALEQTVMDTIQSATSAVQDTIQSVKDSVTSVKDTVADSVESVSEGIKNTFDITAHARNHPWAALGGAAAVGFVTGLLVFRPQTTFREGLSRTGHDADSVTGGRTFGPSYAAPPPAAEPRRRTWWDDLMEAAGQEVKKLAQQAFTTVSATVKQNIEQGVPKMFDGILPEKGGSTANRGGYGYTGGASV